MNRVDTKATVTYYIDKNGTLILAASQQHSLVIDLLAKLGLKSAPKEKMWTFTVPATSWYTFSATFDSSTITLSNSSTTDSNGIITSADITIVEPEVVKVKGFSRDEKKNWRDKWKSHSKNTGPRR